MALAPLVSAAVFATAFPRDLSSSEEDRLDYLLSAASAAVRAYCRRDFTAAESTVRIKPIGDQVKLPNAPATAITSVKRVNFDGSTVAFAGWAWDGGQTLYGMNAIGSPMINAPEVWSDDLYTPLVEVTWSHGDTETPEVVRDVVIGMLAAVLNAPSQIEGLTSQSAGPFSVSVSRDMPTPGIRPRLSEDDKKQLREAGYATGRTAVTVQLG